MSAERSDNSRDAKKRANAISIGEGSSPARTEKDARDENSTAPGATGKVKERVEAPPRSISTGDMPEALHKRYFSSISKWSGDPAYFTTAQAKEPAFRDQGRRLITSSESEEVVRDLVAIARHRGWSNVHLTGSEAFRRAAWFEASRRGLEVRGYRPNERDLQELDRFREGAGRNSIAPAVAPSISHGKDRNRSQARQGAAQIRSADGTYRNERAVQSQLRVIETVVRAALFDNPEAISRVMKVANSKFESHIHQGYRVRPAMVREAGERKPVDIAPTRQTATKDHAPIQRSRGR